jgi:hypothetical protein
MSGEHPDRAETRDLTWCLYNTARRRAGASVQPDHCRAEVYDGAVVAFHQCRRRPVETILGYGFCRQHATKIRRWLARQ